jgi:hypothetical protein
MLPIYLTLDTDLAAMLRLVNLPATSILIPVTPLFLMFLNALFCLLGGKLEDFNCNGLKI